MGALVKEGKSEMRVAAKQHQYECANYLYNLLMRVLAVN